MGSRNPDDAGEGPFYNNPYVQSVVKMYEPIPMPDGDCMTRITKAVGMGLVVGGLYNLIAVPWQPDPVDHFPKGVTKFRDNWKFFRSGFARPMAAFSAVGAAFSGVECLFESMRDPEGKAKHWNSAAGGFAAGVVMGSWFRRVDYALVAGGFNAMLMGSVSFSQMHYANDRHQAAMKVGGKWPKQYVESKELTALKEKYPEFKDL